MTSKLVIKKKSNGIHPYLEIELNREFEENDEHEEIRDLIFHISILVKAYNRRAVERA